MHNLLSRIEEVKEGHQHPEDNSLYRALLGDITSFSNTFKTAENSVKAAEALALAAQAETSAAKSEIAAAHAETNRAKSELSHATNTAVDAVQKFDALSAEMKQLKTEFQAEKKKLIVEGKSIQTNLNKERAEFSKLTKKLESLMSKIKAPAAAPFKPPVQAAFKMPTFDIEVTSRGDNEKIKNVRLTPRGN